MVLDPRKQNDKKLIERNRRLHITFLILKQHEEERKKAFVSTRGFVEVKPLKDGIGDVLQEVGAMRHSLRIQRQRMKSRAKAYFGK